jgi:hypothetical protein
MLLMDLIGVIRCNHLLANVYQEHYRQFHHV